jgi:hypothetical protein
LQSHAARVYKQLYDASDGAKQTPTTYQGLLQQFIYKCHPPNDAV